MADQNLEKVDWFKAGFRALCAEGVKGLRAEALARDLAISKGSFYWHFKNVEDFKQGMLAHWLELGSTAAAAKIWQQVDGARLRLEALIDFAATPPPPEYGGLGTEAAIREWARVEESAAKMYAKVDEFRITTIEDCLADLGFSPSQCELRARLLYAALIGIDQLGITELDQRKAHLKLQLKLVLTKTEDEQ